MSVRRLSALQPGIAGLVVLALGAGSALARQQALPPDIANYIRKQFDENTRYLDASVDLNGDGAPEVVVHVIGPMACGTGGCPTLVFTPSGSGYRLVSSISVSRPPIRASAARTVGWRNLIVSVSGGGAKAHDAELLSNGKTYPSNPSVAGPRVKTAGAGGDVLIAEFKSFEDTKPLPKPGAGSAPSASAATAQPSFDCAKASTPVETLVCGDPALAALDRSLAEAYAKAMAGWPEGEKTAQRTAQRSWIATRNACAKGNDMRGCVESSYRRRLIEVQIKGGQLQAPNPVGFVCKGQEGQPTTVAFYSQTEPKSAVVTMGDRQAIAFITPSGSGAHYVGNSVDFWEHQGEATIKLGAASYTCMVRR